jgi:hypothetical protein
MMVIQLDGLSWMLDDDESLTTSFTVPHSLMSKQHNDDSNQSGQNA